jgi:hypothetical protein
LNLSPTLLANLVTTWALVGLIWVVELAVYPLYERIGAASFAAYHEGWTTGITWIVGPLMLGELLACGAWLVERPRLGVLLALPVAVAWAVTAFWAVPMHGRLAAGFDEAAWRSLLWANHVRTAAWTLRGAALVVAALRS